MRSLVDDRKHFYWAVTSTQERLGEVKLAKFQAFLHHVINQHTDLPNRLFNACAHGDILLAGSGCTEVYYNFNSGTIIIMITNVNSLIASEAYEKLTCALNKTTLTNAIKKASAVEQTSCLEEYHSMVNQFAPKMLAYSYLGMLCRYT